MAVYDWDSVATGAGEHRARPGGRHLVRDVGTRWIPFPSAAGVAAFLEDYETAAGAALTDAQVRAAGAAAVWNLAYIARCEHALAASGRARPDQHGAGDRLRTDGEVLLHMTQA